MDQGVTLHIVISNLVNSINPTFSLGGYPHFFPHGLDRSTFSIFFHFRYLLLREYSFRTQKIWESSTKIRAGFPALIRLQYYLFLMEVEDE